MAAKPDGRPVRPITVELSLVVVLSDYSIRVGSDGRHLLGDAVPEIQLLQGLVPVLVQEQWPAAFKACAETHTHTHTTAQ